MSVTQESGTVHVGSDFVSFPVVRSRMPRPDLLSMVTTPPRHLESVRDELAKDLDVQDPADVPAPLMRWQFDWTGNGTGQLQARLLGRDGFLPPVLLTRDAYMTALRAALPSYGYATLDALVGKGMPGRKVSTMALALLFQGQEKNLVARTMLLPDGKTRVIRDFVSDSYSTYLSDIQVIEGLLADPDFRDMPVLAYDRENSAMRLRLANTRSTEWKGIDTEARHHEHVGLKNPLPIVDVWNSETGDRSCSFTAGMFTLWCTNGVMSFAKDATYRIRHTGSDEGQATRFAAALETIAVKSTGVIAAYNQAVNTAIDDFAGFMNDALGVNGFGLPKAQIEGAMARLDDERVVHTDRSLANVVDTLTLIAQDQDLAGQRLLEEAAAFALQRGLKDAKGDRIPVRPIHDNA